MFKFNKRTPEAELLAAAKGIIGYFHSQSVCWNCGLPTKPVLPCERRLARAIGAVQGIPKSEMK